MHVGGSLPSADDDASLTSIVGGLARLLPAQGPISVFVHHNPLHAYEHLDFEDAVRVAGSELGRESYLSAERYGEELARGRITAVDVRAVLAAELLGRADEPLAGMRRLELRARVITHGIPTARDSALAWILTETDAVTRYRADLPDDVREAALAGGPDAEAEEVRALWQACLETALATARRAGPSPRVETPSRRHRDLLLAARGIDIDDLVHPPLIRFTSAYLDQGLAARAMPERDAGMLRCFGRLYGSRLSVLLGEAWMRSLPALVASDVDGVPSGAASARRSLAALGVPPTQWASFLEATVLALRGWAGMVRQIEERPDRIPARPVPATLVDFVAVRLLLERAALAHVASGLPLGLDELRTALGDAPPPDPPLADVAWPLFHAAQLCGISADALDAMSAVERDAFVAEVAALDDLERRRVLQGAYERHLRDRLYDALVEPPGSAPAPPAPAYQVAFCLDEREESIRRHLEEVDPEAETLGTAGFFGVAMYYRGATDAHPRPLCPVAIVPQHYIAEAAATAVRPRRLARRGEGIVARALHHGSRTLVGGALVMTGVGVLSLVPLVLKVVFPWLGRRLRKARLRGAARSPTRLQVERSATPPPIGRFSGFTREEQVEIVATLLETTGIGPRLAPLVIVFGHGSASLNNPHASAYDCGACGGGRGGPNARAFAHMANDPGVRADLAKRGVVIAPSTWFVGGERNTSDSSLTYFDLDRIPDATRPLFERARRSLAEARLRDAHERSRRFDIAPTWLPPAVALVHVEARGADLAQPRPELGHATNAYCIVGRRARTRGLFLDRRSFLVSYDPSTDRDGTVLQRLLAAVTPVVIGINLEYYFGTIDPTGYGCGTKLPHNITSLLGVMDGAQSDLRTGLPWQMVEIHEPCRLTFVVEQRPEVLRTVLDRDPTLHGWVARRWLSLACLDPEAPVVWEWPFGTGAGTVTRHRSEHVLPRSRGGSLTWYGGRRGHLPVARLVVEPSPAAGRSP